MKVVKSRLYAWILSIFTNDMIKFKKTFFNGECRFSGFYQHGKRIGYWQWFDKATHAVIKEASYSRGKLNYIWYE